ncbi:MAG: repeat-containing protein [Phycisphaerales bacterium]|nr:repeat-containing protein [Phycisphaerales bacterium]
MECSCWLSSVTRAAVQKVLARAGRGVWHARQMAEPLEQRLALSAAPSIVSITRASPANSVTDAASVAYTVTFSEPVVGVAASDFTLALNGVTASAPLTVSGSGAVYSVGVNGIAGNGTLGLNFVDHGAIHDLAGSRLLRPNAPAAFADQQNFSFPNPGSFAVADLNRDGKPDMIVSNRQDASLTALLGNGDGTFNKTTAFGGTPAYGSSPTIADVNRDGKPDLLVAGSTGYGVLIGNGDGTFQSPKYYGANSYPGYITCADLNGDGVPDLVGINFANNSVSVLLGNGDGSFQAPQTLAIGNRPGTVAVADFNADGKADLLVTNFDTPTVSIFLGNGDGTFKSGTSFGAGYYPSDAIVADLNADGKPDVVVASGINSTLQVLLGNGDGTFQPPAQINTSFTPNRITAADVNQDGKLDLIYTTTGSPGTVNVLPGNGDATFQAKAVVASGGNLQGVVVADFNGDGLPDILAAETYYNFFAVVPGDANDGYTGPLYTIDHPLPSVQSIARTAPAGPLIHSDTVTYKVTFTQPVTGVDLTDFALALNGPTGQISQVTPVSGAVYTVTVDGISGSGTLGLNLVDDGSIHNLAGEGLVSFTGSFTSTQVLTTGSKPTSLAVADANGDGNPDLFVTNSGDATISEFQGNGDGTFQTLPLFAAGVTNPYFDYTADFNQDGKPDLLDGAVLLGKGDGTFQSPPPQFTGRPLCIADMNGDGFPDLVVPGIPYPYSIGIALGRGDGTFRDSIFYPLPVTHFVGAIAAGDMNSDGNMDLIAANDGVITVSLGRGDGTFHQAYTYSSSRFYSSMQIADVNHDGIPDVIAVNADAGGISVLLGNGDGTLQPPISTVAYTFHSSLTLADVNADGNIDAVINTPFGTVTVLPGNGDGTFQPAQTLSTGTYASSTIVADVNRDGRPDLVLNDYYTNTATVLLNGGNGDRTGEVYAVNSATPVVNPFVLTAGVEGTPTPRITCSFTGQPQDTFTASVTYGDRSYGFVLALNGKNFTLSNTYQEAGTYNVTVVITDTTAGLVSDPFTATITISDAPVVATITGAPATIALGGSVNLNFTATNPDTQEMGPLVESWTIQDGSNAVVASGTGGPYTFTPAAVGTYTVTFTAGESTVADAETGTATATITVNPAAPTLLATQIDDGNRQRSLIRSLTFTFSSPVTLSAGAFTLVRLNTGGSGANDGSAPTDASAALGTPTSSDGGLTWVVPIQTSTTFSAFGSLVDGIYSATVHAALVTDAFGQPLTGGDQTKTFHRLYGDINGDKKISNADFTFFSNAYNASLGQVNYNQYFDFTNNNAKIGNADFTQFANRFNKTFVYT